MHANTFPATAADPARFVGLHRFDDFTAEPTPTGRVLLSPALKAPIDWNELVVSWNATAPAGAWLKVEARALYPDHQTKYYTLADWSLNAPGHVRQSVRHQKDDDGDVKTDTWQLRRPGADVQLRLTLGATNLASPPELKFLGLAYLDTRVTPEEPASDRSAWGKIITTPERSQHGYPQEEGWCSPTSLSMVLARWSDELHRPEMTLDVPAVASNVFDSTFGGTGNWTFNTAFAGSYPVMRAYVARLRDLTELETWINAGIPVVISAPWHLLQPGRGNTGSGHLVVCIGFTENGDVVINDPATNLQKGQKVRHIYTRENVRTAWKASHNTVYLIYPETFTPPPDPLGHWDK
ncbi:MAG TPA: peptidase C39 family protein [Verrucomicrobiae bacterium]|jgi:hypothetical protein|nr:peptidase C39 family protein [Verrucomicrobiae bacterium]